MSKRRKSTKPKFEKKGSKLSHVGIVALQYGVRPGVIYKLGLERFLAMSEDARRLYVRWSKQGRPNGEFAEDFKRGGLQRLYPWRRSVDAAVLRTGRTTADWMELMARSPQWWKERPEPKKRPAQCVDWPDVELPEEQGWRVERMVEKAMRARVA